MSENKNKNNDESHGPGSFINKLLDKIKEDNLSPRPRWQFLLKKYTLYVVGGISLLIGAIAVSVMIYLFKFNDWALYGQTKKSFWEFLLLTLPYFWFLFLALFILIIYYNLKHTPQGYRYSGGLLIGASVSLSIILGFVFFSFGLGEKIDDVLGRQAPFYSHVFNRQIGFWSQPDEGRLAGIIISCSEAGDCVLLDRELNEWRIFFSPSASSSGNIIIKQPVHLIGKQTSEDEFSADKILMAGRPGQGFFRDLENRPRPRRMMKLLIPPGAPAPTPMPYY